MATLMEKDTLLNGTSQYIAFLSNAFRKLYNSQNQELDNDINELISYRDQLYSTDANFIDFKEGVSRFQKIRAKYNQELKKLGYPANEK